MVGGIAVLILGVTTTIVLAVFAPYVAAVLGLILVSDFITFLVADWAVHHFNPDDEKDYVEDDDNLDHSMN